MKTLKRSECAVLSLVLKGKWYDMIERGEKTEEYRDPSEYWRRRLCNWNRRSTPHVPPVVEFRRGYAKDAPRMAFWCLTSSIAPHALYYGFMARREHPEWGEPSTPHFVIRLGDRVALAEAPDGAGASKSKEFCEGDCNSCEAIHNRQVSVILNALYELYGEDVYRIVQHYCPNLTCCADCCIDDFCHSPGCELRQEARRCARAMKGGEP